MRRLVTTIATAALVAGTLVLPTGTASASRMQDPLRESRSDRVRVTSDASGMDFSTTSVHEGRVTFGISTRNPDGLDVTLFQLRRGVSFARFRADLAEAFSPVPLTAAKGTRHLVRDARFYGLADVQPGTPATATVNLSRGIYYAFDSGSPNGAPPAPTPSSVIRLRVFGGGHDDSRDDQFPRVSLTSQDRFVVRGQLRARGSVLVRNVSDTIHFMEIQRVRPGTTDAQVQAYFDSGSQNPPPFALDGPSVGMDVLSPGRSLELRYSLPRGTYVLLCFISDDVTGMPHAVMGMHKVVSLR